jgi:hypothetical protein
MKVMLINTTPPLPIGYMIESFKTPTKAPVKAPAPKIPLPKVLLPASKVPIRNITPDIINKFLKLVYTDNDKIWTDCGASGQIAKLQTNEFYPAIDIIKNLGINNLYIKETDKTLSILKLCSSNTILNNTIDSANGNSIIQGNYGPILPFTHTTFKVDEKLRNDICKKLTNHIDKQKWTSCNTLDMFQQFVSTCEIDLNTDFTGIVNYNFDKTNKNPHIIQLIDMCRSILKLKFEITYNSITKKIVFYKFCKENIEKKFLPFF